MGPRGLLTADGSWLHAAGWWLRHPSSRLPTVVVPCACVTVHSRVCLPSLPAARLAGLVDWSCWPPLPAVPACACACVLAHPNSWLCPVPQCPLTPAAHTQALADLPRLRSLVLGACPLIPLEAVHNLLGSSKGGSRRGSSSSSSCGSGGASSSGGGGSASSSNDGSSGGSNDGSCNAAGCRSNSSSSSSSSLEVVELKQCGPDGLGSVVVRREGK